jgi:hypothetical protein
MRTVLLGVLALALAPVVRILVVHLRLRARSYRLAAALRMPAGSSYTEQDADGSTLHVEIGWTRRAAQMTLAHKKPANAVDVDVRRLGEQHVPASATAAATRSTRSIARASSGEG